MASKDTENHSRREIQAAIAKAVELRSLHAALLHTSSPNNGAISNNKNINYRRHPSSSSCASPVLPGFTPQDYPVFTPSYGDAQYPVCHDKNPKLSESWDERTTVMEEEEELGNDFSDHRYKTSVSRNKTPFRRSPQAENNASRRRNNSLSDFRSVSYFKHTVSSGGFDAKSTKNNNIVVPLTDSHSSVLSSQPRNRGVMAWLFPRFKKKNNNKNRNMSPFRTDKLNESDTTTMEKLNRDLLEANRRRDAAVMEVSEMKYSLRDLNQKLEHLEKYCEGLKESLKHTSTPRENINSQNLVNDLGKRVTKSIQGNTENQSLPVTDEAMVEGFLQIVSESRLSVKQFLKTLIAQIDENDTALMGNLDSILQPYDLTFSSKYSRKIQYHLEAIINQILYQDFENCIFQNNGMPKFLDPEEDRQAQFSSYVSLRNLSWNEVLKKGTKHYSGEFSRFCDQKMGLIVTKLNWTRSWSEELLQAFFVAAKCVWLLHLLAFSFNPALQILRVGENKFFDSDYMEDMAGERQRLGFRSPARVRVRVMVMPGFYVHDRVLECKVLCKHKSLS